MEIDFSNKSRLAQELREGFMTRREYNEYAQFVRETTLKYAGQRKTFTIIELIENEDLTPDYRFVWIQIRALVNAKKLKRIGKRGRETVYTLN